MGPTAAGNAPGSRLVLVTLPETYQSPFLLAVFGGLINPMIVAYVACYKPGFARVRRILSWAIFACMISTWAFFAINQFLPLIGHIMWIVGIALILAGEFSTPSSERCPARSRHNRLCNRFRTLHPASHASFTPRVLWASGTRGQQDP